jgi:hypothetical protein
MNGDEVQSNPANKDLVDLDTLVPARFLDGIEVHFGPDGPTWTADGCGSLLLWSSVQYRRVDEPFRGSLRGFERSAPPDTVLQVRLDATGKTVVPTAIGLFRFDDLLPGLYQVAFLGPKGVITRQEVRVYAHQEASLEVRIEGTQPTAAPQGPRR